MSLVVEEVIGSAVDALVVSGVEVPSSFTVVLSGVFSGVLCGSVLTLHVASGVVACSVVVSRDVSDRGTDSVVAWTVVSGDDCNFVVVPFCSIVVSVVGAGVVTGSVVASLVVLGTVVVSVLVVWDFVVTS